MFTMYIFYEKPMASSTVIQRRSAMPENMRVATLTQETIRRMMNTSERIELQERIEVIDNYGMKLVNSGYSLDQSRKMIVGGLVGYERRLALSRDTTNLKWRPLHEGAKFNATGRRNKKLMARNNWYKRKAEDSSLTSPDKRRKSEVQQ